MKPDLHNREDVELLVNAFYDAVKQSPLIGYIFTDVAQVNWQTHLPRMYDFWTTLLFHDHSYSGNPMHKHVELAKHTSLTEIEFNEWIHLFHQTVDALFEGERANEAKERAASIARLMLHKVRTSV